MCVHDMYTFIYTKHTLCLCVSVSIFLSLCLYPGMSVTICMHMCMCACDCMHVYRYNVTDKDTCILGALISLFSFHQFILQRSSLAHQ